MSVQEPVGDFILGRVLHHRGDLLEIILGKLSGALVDVDIGLTTADEGKTTTNSLKIIIRNEAFARTTLMAVKANGTLRLPSILVLRTR